MGARHRHRAVPGAGGEQVQPEIPSLPVLLEPLDLDWVVVTADAMHTQVDTAEWIVGRGGHYLLTPLGTQKTLHRTLKALPWKNVPSTSWVDTGHERRRSPPGWTSPGLLPTHDHAQPEAIAAWPAALEPLSPQPPDPCQDAPNELSDH